MCVKLFIEWSKPTRRFEKRAADIEARLPIEFFLESGASDEPLAVSIAEKGKGCGCSLVEKPDWRASSWTITARMANFLAETVANLETSAPFTLRPAWLGADQPAMSREELTVAELVSRIRSGNVVPGRRYVASIGG
jgi:hypothetical protein